MARGAAPPRQPGRNCDGAHSGTASFGCSNWGTASTHLKGKNHGSDPEARACACHVQSSRQDHRPPPRVRAAGIGEAARHRQARTRRARRDRARLRQDKLLPPVRPRGDPSWDGHEARRRVLLGREIGKGNPGAGPAPQGGEPTRGRPPWQAPAEVPDVGRDLHDQRPLHLRRHDHLRADLHLRLLHPVLWTAGIAGEWACGRIIVDTTSLPVATR